MTTILPQPEPQTDSEAEAVLVELWEEIQHLREMMDADQVEIERLKAGSLQLKVETRSLLASLEALVKPC